MRGGEGVPSFDFSCDPSYPLWFPLCALCRSKHHRMLPILFPFFSLLSSSLSCRLALLVTPGSPPHYPLKGHFICSHFSKSLCNAISGCWQKTRVLYSELWRRLNLPAKVSLAACSVQLPRRLIESNYVSMKQVNNQNGVYTAHSEWPVTLVETYARHAIFSLLGKEMFNTALKRVLNRLVLVLNLFLVKL